MSSSAHPPDGELRALVDGELPAPRALELRQHAAQCPACAARFREIEQDALGTGQLLDLLPVGESPLELQVVVRRARQARLRRAGLIAAAVSLFAVSIAGATVGRGLVDRVWAMVHPRSRIQQSAAVVPHDSMGIAFVPEKEADVVFDTKQDQGQLNVALADTAELVIRSDAPVAYRINAQGVVVHNPGSRASYEILIPRALPHVRILIGGRVVLEKLGPRIVAGTDSAPNLVLPVR
ncbi:MAG TPA: zf-HC2 domain-containing protein [Gemmatimonadales bacterium]|nr:zf-HC2 domain-containing protein [Gemmatimonadales bacterium]